MDKKRVLQYVTSVIIAPAFFLTGAYTQGLLQKADRAEFFGTLSDCFLFPAVLLGGVGAMSWISEMGNLDMLSYGCYFMFHALLHPLTPHETYYDYKVRKSEERGTWLKHWLVVGMACFGASVVCLLVYMKISS